MLKRLQHRYCRKTGGYRRKKKRVWGDAAKISKVWCGWCTWCLCRRTWSESIKLFFFSVQHSVRYKGSIVENRYKSQFTIVLTDESSPKQDAKSSIFEALGTCSAVKLWLSFRTSRFLTILAGFADKVSKLDYGEKMAADKFELPTFCQSSASQIKRVVLWIPTIIVHRTLLWLFSSASYDVYLFVPPVVLQPPPLNTPVVFQLFGTLAACRASRLRLRHWNPSPFFSTHA